MAAPIHIRVDGPLAHCGLAPQKTLVSSDLLAQSAEREITAI
jgi:hypothetical protein